MNRSIVMVEKGCAYRNWIHKHNCNSNIIYTCSTHTHTQCPPDTAYHRIAKYYIIVWYIAEEQGGMRFRSYLKINKFTSTHGTHKFSMKHSSRHVELVFTPVFRREIACMLSPISNYNVFLSCFVIYGVDFLFFSVLFHFHCGMFAIFSSSV